MAEISIQRLVEWALINERAETGPGITEALAGSTGKDSVQRVYEVWLIGGFVDGGGAMRPPEAEDAITVADAIARLAPNRRYLVIRQGKIAQAPDWGRYAVHRWEPTGWERECHEGRAERCSATLVPNGHDPGFWWEGGRKHKRRVYSEWVPVREIDAPAMIEANREIYRQWWEALDELRAMIGGALDRWQLTDEMPPRRPWL